MKVRSCVLVYLLLTSSVVAQLPEVLNDNFDDNNIDGWRFVDPIGEILGSPVSSVIVENGAVRLVAPATPSAELGLARAAMVYESIVLSDFELSLDVVERSTAIGSGVGIGARANEAGAGTSDGYSASFAIVAEEEPRALFGIFRLDDELPVLVSEPAPFELDDDMNVRLEFSGEGGLLSASVLDLNDPGNVLAAVSAVDDTYTSGAPWFFTAGNFDAMGVPILTSTGDATIDNYRAAGTLVPEPSSVGLFLIGTLVAAACLRGARR